MESSSRRFRGDLRHTLISRRASSNHRSPVLQWRKKHKEVECNIQEATDSFRSSRHPLKRNLELHSLLPEKQLPTTEEIMGELRDVTICYMNVPSPTESAARRERERVYQGEANGLMAETANSILVAAQASLQAQVTQQSGPSTMLALEVSNTPQDLPQLPEAPTKKRRGMPPLKPHKGGISPLKLTGINSRQRKMYHIQQSPKRKTNNKQTVPLNEENKITSDSQAEGSRRGGHQSANNKQIPRQ